LGFDPGNKFTFAFRNTEAIKGFFDLRGDLIACAFSALVIGEILVNCLEIEVIDAM
jgi:hypothetical protein